MASNPRPAPYHKASIAEKQRMAMARARPLVLARCDVCGVRVAEHDLDAHVRVRCAGVLLVAAR